MRRGDPNIRRALVTRLSTDRKWAWVLVEWMKVQRQKDQGAIQGQVPLDGRGVKAVSQSGVQLGDEVLVDFRPLPVAWLSFLFFGVPLILFVVAAFLGQGLGQALTLPQGGVVVLQMTLGVAGLVASYLYADRVQSDLRAQGLGTPVVTAVMPRFAGEGTDTLQALFRLSGPVEPATWDFASEELDRITGVVEAKLEEDRVEVIFRKDILKEKHLLELLLLLGFPLVIERDLG